MEKPEPAVKQSLSESREPLGGWIPPPFIPPIVKNEKDGAE